MPDSLVGVEVILVEGSAAQRIGDPLGFGYVNGRGEE